MNEAQPKLPRNIWIRGVLWALLTIAGLLVYSGWANADLGPDSGATTDQGAEDMTLIDGAGEDATVEVDGAGEDATVEMDGAAVADGGSADDGEDDDDGCSCTVGTTRGMGHLGLPLLLGLVLIPIVRRRQQG